MLSVGKVRHITPIALASPGLWIITPQRVSSAKSFKTARGLGAGCYEVSKHASRVDDWLARQPSPQLGLDGIAHLTERCEPLGLAPLGRSWIGAAPIDVMCDSPVWPISCYICEQTSFEGVYNWWK
jgi:hypothetical protein